MTILKKLWNDQSGASAAEYALILAIVGSAIAVAAWTLGNTIATEFNEAGNCIDGVVEPGQTTAPTSC